MTALDTTAAVEAGRLLAGYAKQHAAGAFATPTRKDLEREPSMIRRWGDSRDWFVAVSKILRRDSPRRDWTGRRMILPAGARIATHLAATQDAPLPDDLGCDWLQSYADDHRMTARIENAGYVRAGTRISAASELIAVWGPEGSLFRESPVDLVDIGFDPMTQPTSAQRQQMLKEVDRVDSWSDDFPYYSDGSWDAISLRGYRPDDPTWGVKPSEMGAKWHQQHPEAHKYRCEWTTLAEKMPSIREFVTMNWKESQLDRVRLMRMDGSRGSVLRRHSDITDRSAGTRLGQMVRFFVPIKTHASVTTTSWSLDGWPQAVHLPEWQVCYLDIRKPHEVNNPSGRQRVHLAVDVHVDESVQEQVLRCVSSI